MSGAVRVAFALGANLGDRVGALRGAVLALVKRTREARKAVLAESREQRAGEHPDPIPAPTGPALPAHGRSRL